MWICNILIKIIQYNIMQVTTKYNNGDLVFPIETKTETNIVVCPTCNGTDEILINNTDRKIKCPDCYKGRIVESRDYGYIVLDV